MNAIAPVSQFQPSSDPSQFKPSDSLDPSSQSAPIQDFNSAMHVASDKPAPRSRPTKSPRPSNSGNSSPASGSQSPLPLPPNAALPASASKVSAAEAPAALLSATPAAAPASTPLSAPALAPLPAPAIAAPAPPNSSTAASTDSPPATAAIAFSQLIDSATAHAEPIPAADPPPSPPPAAGSANSAAGVINPAVPPPVTSASLPTPKFLEVASVNAVTHAAHANNDDTANSTLTSTSSTAASDAIAATDNAAQTALAAAAAARLANAADSDAAASPNFLGAADSAATPDAAAAPPVVPVVVTAVPAPHAGAAQTVVAAASNARTISALAGVIADTADKPSHSMNVDGLFPAASNDGGAGASQLLSGTAPVDAPAPTFKVAAPVETTDFSQGVADRVSFMVDGNISSAKLQVNPPALGPIEVRIALQGAHAQVSFTSHSALTRDALESSAPKLRELLGAQGFGQVDVDVSQGGSFQDRAAQSAPYQGSAAATRDSGTDAAQSASRVLSRAPTGTLDAYA